MPSNAEAGNYKLRVEGRLDELVSGNIFFNETEIEFTPKHASIFIQMSKPIYRQEQLGILEKLIFICNSLHYFFGTDICLNSDLYGP